MWDAALVWFRALPNVLVYVLLGAGAGIENVVPAVPADTFVVLGGFLSAVGDVQARWVFLATWTCNVCSALFMYHMGYRYGKSFFATGWGRHILNRHQMQRMVLFYGRWGTGAVFLTRFLPGLRAVVPLFAGVTHQRFLSVAVPLALASALWYGALVWAGTFAGRNLDRVLGVLGEVNVWLLAVAVAVFLGLFAWWWRTRHHGRHG